MAQVDCGLHLRRHACASALSCWLYCYFDLNAVQLTDWKLQLVDVFSQSLSVSGFDLSFTSVRLRVADIHTGRESWWF